MQQALLTAVAHSSGGEFFTLENADKLPDVIREKMELVHAPVEKSIWDTWLMICLLLLSTSLEWFIRKQVDLP